MRLSTDTKEGALLNQYPDILAELLKDHTTGRNIFWATDNYASQGEGYGFHDEITIERITGLHTDLIRPRALKSKTEQKGRTKDMAEVFTPTWVCNRQANLLDEAWFGRPNVFNVEDHATKTWRTVRDPIAFPPGKTWRDYIRQTCLEITCGEAPYLVSRYDAADGHAIPLADRIGLLDRKLRVVSEHVSKSGEWLEMAQEAYKHTLGFEWQGDSLLLAREALLVSFIEYYEAHFGRLPLKRSLLYIAYIIAWNVFQMDGLRGVVPCSCRDMEEPPDLFGESKTKPCEGCQQGGYRNHNGTYCLLRNWGARDPRTGKHNPKIRFVDLIHTV